MEIKASEIASLIKEKQEKKKKAKKNVLGLIPQEWGKTEHKIVAALKDEGARKVLNLLPHSGDYYAWVISSGELRLMLVHTILKGKYTVVFPVTDKPFPPRSGKKFVPYIP